MSGIKHGIKTFKDSRKEPQAICKKYQKPISEVVLYSAAQNDIRN